MKIYFSNFFNFSVLDRVFMGNSRILGWLTVRLNLIEYYMKLMEFALSENLAHFHFNNNGIDKMNYTIKALN